MEPNVRIEDLEAVLGRQEKPPGECPLCRKSMEEHTVLTEPAELGRPKSVVAIGWACPRELLRKAVEPEEELRWIGDQLKGTGTFHDLIQQRLEDLGKIVAKRAQRINRGQERPADWIGD